MAPSTETNALDPAFVEQIKAAVLNDNAPEILECIALACKEEAAKAQPAALERMGQDKEDQFTRNYFFWLFLCHNFDWLVRDLRKSIRERTMTREQVDAEKRAETLRKMREELKALEGRV